MSDFVHVSTHPVVQHKITQLRRKDINQRTFRQLLGELTFYLGYEATATLKLKDEKVETPLTVHTGKKISSKVALIPIMRAGLGMVHSMQELVPTSKVFHLGMFRNKESLLPVLYFNKLPPKPDVDTAIILEPMIATAGTLNAVIDIVKEWSERETTDMRICVMTVIASKPGLAALKARHPDIKVYCCAVDEELNEEGYIIPGLGDAGDRQFGTEHGPVNFDRPLKRPKLNGA